MVPQKSFSEPAKPSSVDSKKLTQTPVVISPNQPEPHPKENINRTKTEPNQNAAINAVCSEHAEILAQIKTVPSFPMPEKNFDNKEVCYQLLIQNEEPLLMSRSANYKPIELRKA